MSDVKVVKANGIELLKPVTDRFTGFTGIAWSRTVFLYACVRIAILPTDLKDGVPKDMVYCDERQLVEYMEDPVPYVYDGIQVGQKVTDSITGKSGIVVAKTEYGYQAPHVRMATGVLNDKGDPIDLPIEEQQTIEWQQMQKPANGTLDDMQNQPQPVRHKTGGPGAMASRPSMAPAR